MPGRILALLLCFFTICVQGQAPGAADKSNSPTKNAAPQEDALLKSLSDAERFQRAGDLAGAAVSNREVLGIALQRMGVVAIETGDYADAAGYLKESLAFSDTAAGRTNLAIAYMRQNLFDDALREAHLAVGFDPDHVGAHYILANIYYAQENYEAALPELEFVFARSPDFEIARALGFTYLSLKQIDKARAHFEATRRLLKEDSAGVHVLFAKFYERTNYPEDAEREIKRALAIDPKAPKVNLYLGYLLLQTGGSERIAESLEAFKKERELTPDDFYPNFFAGVAASSNNDHEQAIPFLK
jgi:tetratricopeptide (TPR) repeat protein